VLYSVPDKSHSLDPISSTPNPRSEYLQLLASAYFFPHLLYLYGGACIFGWTISSKGTYWNCGTNECPIRFKISFLHTHGHLLFRSPVPPESAGIPAPSPERWRTALAASRSRPRTPPRARPSEPPADTPPRRPKLKYLGCPSFCTWEKQGCKEKATGCEFGSSLVFDFKVPFFPAFFFKLRPCRLLGVFSNAGPKERQQLTAPLSPVLSGAMDPGLQFLGPGVCPS
jgi:hypothetical protein